MLCTCIMLFGKFLWCPRHNYHAKPPSATFYGGHEHSTTNFSFSFWTWIKSYSTLRQITYIWQTKLVQIDAVKFERMQINSFSDVSLLLLLSLLKFPTVPLRTSVESFTDTYQDTSRGKGGVNPYKTKLNCWVKMTGYWSLFYLTTPFQGQWSMNVELWHTGVIHCTYAEG